MRLLARNLQTFWYCLRTNSQVQYDEYGNETGENAPMYAAPVECQGNISWQTGNTDIEQFGQNLDYDRVIVLADMDTPISEDTVLFVDHTPVYEGGVLTNAYDYIVRRVSKSLNVVSIAIKRVDVTKGGGTPCSE